MKTITVRRYPTGKSLRLNPIQQLLFDRELARVKKHFPYGKGPPPWVAPDCVITVMNGKRTTRYRLYSRAVLMEDRRKRTWQFYFGLLLLEWLR